MTEINIDFSNDEMSQFLKRIEVQHSKISSDFLRNIVAGIIEHIPFQNVSMLTNKWVRPNEEMIKHDMLSGLGGLCTVRNPFLHQFLIALGFDVRFVSSTINEPDCHISLVVNMNNEDWWVDVGNGFPYLEPIRLGDEKIKKNWFMEYRLVKENSRYYVHHKLRGKDWKINHHFSPDGVKFSVFDKMHNLHYSVPGWGPFLTGLRINRFWDEGGVVIRDERALSPDGESELDSVSKVESWLEKWFTKPGFTDSINIKNADNVWRRERRRCGYENDS